MSILNYMDLKLNDSCPRFARGRFFLPVSSMLMFFTCKHTVTVGGAHAGMVDDSVFNLVKVELTRAFKMPSMGWRLKFLSTTQKHQSPT